MERTVETGHISIGVKPDIQKYIALSKIEYLLLHNWQNENSRLYKVKVHPTYARKDDIEESYFCKYKDSEDFILLTFDPHNNLFTSQMDVKHLQPSDRKKIYDLSVVSYNQLLEPNV